jgi:glycosyltransferase involved in cell wall biosynthesis
MAEQRALWVSVSTETRGGIASYVRAMQQTGLWTDWNIRHVATQRDGSTALKIAAFARGALFFVVELIRFRPNVIHLHTSARGSFVRKAALFWISRPFRVPVVMHMHASGFPAFYENSPRVAQAVIRATLSRASAFIALGEVWSARMRVIAPTARIIAIPNAVQLGRRTTQPASGEPVHVVFLGRIGDHKGAFNLLDAWAKLTREPDFGAGPRIAAKLTLAGDGDVERARRQIRELDLESTVELHDWLSETEVGDLLDHAQVLVLPSRNEGQPMAVLEAMARGLCVIATNVGGLPEMIGDGCGIVIPPDDTEAIAAALRLVVDDHELRAQCGAAAYARVESRFDICAVQRRLDALYREVSR